MRKVLIIDDEPAIAEFVAAVVESELGFAPIVACSEETALEFLESFDYALVISDTLSFKPHLPAERGGDRWAWLDRLAQKLETVCPGVSLLMMTAYPSEIYKDYAAHGLKGLISKPFDLREVLREVREALVTSPNLGQEEPSFPVTSFTARKPAAFLRLEYSTFNQFAL